MTEPFLIFGHRGSPKRFPENTIASFEEALRAGADGFETDLRLLSDRVAVLYHDDEYADDEFESLSSLDLSERGAVVQQLRDLDAFAGRTTMILEVKRSKWEDVVLDFVTDWPNVVVASFDHSAIAEFARRGIPFDLGLTVYGYILGLPDYAARLGVKWVFPNYHYVDADLVSELHHFGIKVVPYTPNRVREWTRLREIGCDGVITDLPGEAVEWRRASAGGGEVRTSDA